MRDGNQHGAVSEGLVDDGGGRHALAEGFRTARTVVRRAIARLRARV